MTATATPVKITWAPETAPPTTCAGPGSHGRRRTGHGGSRGGHTFTPNQSTSPGGRFALRQSDLGHSPGRCGMTGTEPDATTQAHSCLEVTELRAVIAK